MSVVATWERHQISVYLVALVAGAAVGLGWRSGAEPLEALIFPVLGALLWATFLQVPFPKLTAAFRDTRFLGAVLVLNFLVVPLVVAVLTAIVSLPRAVLLGVLLTLLCPCIDYVIVFSGLAGGDSQRLVAASPLVMLVQMLALPLLLWVFMGPDLRHVVEPGPFLEAFGLLIVLPVVLAAVTQLLATRHRLGVAVEHGMAAAMVPLMAATLFVVVASQVPQLDGRRDEVATAVPVYVGFIVIMTALGLLAARASRLDVAAGRALVFSGVTRNSLVVLPLALALPATFAVTPAVVVTQTLVELVAMVALIRLLPRLLPAN